MPSAGIVLTYYFNIVTGKRSFDSWLNGIELTFQPFTFLPQKIAENFCFSLTVNFFFSKSNFSD